MNLRLIRSVFTDTSTIGKLCVDGEKLCYTLEDAVRDTKIAGLTAIPKGRYQVIINHSPRFGRDLPLLLNVPNYEGVRIHPGNDATETEGCILVGTTHGKDFIGGSRKAFNLLMDKLKGQTDIFIDREEIGHDRT
jgi:hypothetical protein